ncbi:MAG: GAF domain-containing protein, partial [Myxococcota bacterium]
PPEEPLNTRELNIRRQIKNAPATVMEMPAYEPDREVPKAYLAGKAREMAEKHGKREALGFQPEEARVIDEAMTRSQQMRAHGAESIDEAIEQVVETAVEDVFLEIYDLFDDSMTMERAIDFVLDLAMRAIRPESGSVLFATPDGKSLRFASARGPRADEVLAFTVPMNKGIAGFCTREGASLSISNVQEDPRFYADISQALDYPTKCIICAPFVYEGRVYGCIELLNKKGADSFPLSDANALTYIGKQMGMFIHQTLSNIA